MCARQYQLNPSQQVLFFINTHDGPARNFLLNKSTDNYSYDQVRKIMLKEYDSDLQA